VPAYDYPVKLNLSFAGGHISAEVEDASSTISSTTVPGDAGLTLAMMYTIIDELFFDMSIPENEIELTIGSGFISKANGYAFRN